MVSGPSSPQMFVGLGTPNGQGIVDDSADAVPFIQTGNSGGRVSLSELTVPSSPAGTGAEPRQLDIRQPARGGIHTGRVDHEPASAHHSPLDPQRLRHWLPSPSRS